MKKIIAAPLLLCVILTVFFSLLSCDGAALRQQDAADGGNYIGASYDGDDITAEWSGADGASTVIDLSRKNGVEITEAGTYIITGVLEDGQISVNSPSGGTVRLVLNGASVNCSDGAAICIWDAEKAILTLADGTANTVSDGKNYKVKNDEHEPSGAIFSKTDLTINGGGSLTVNANYNHGIHSKGELKIMGGTVTVNSANDGIKGRDGVAVHGGTIKIKAGCDGIQSNNGKNTAKGFVIIEGGTLGITAGSEGIRSETSVSVSGGDITVNSTGDCFKSSGNAFFSGASLNLTSGNDGIHAKNTLRIDSGSVTVNSSVEGLEAKTVIINGGNIILNSSDDGINTSESGGSSSGGGNFGKNSFGDTVTDTHLYINGGYLKIKASGDGIDSNGSIYVTGGEIYIDGPTASDDAGIDFNGEFVVSGGVIISTGSAEMSLNASASSTQCAVLINLTSRQPKNSEFKLTDKNGDTVISYAPSKKYQSVFISCPSLSAGASYKLISDGKELASFTQSSTATLYGAAGKTAGGYNNGRGHG